MYNPFVPFDKKLLEAFIANNKKFFVRQTFPRGMPVGETSIKNAFLMSHYSELKEAMVHFHALKSDHYIFLYEADNEEHLHKLTIAVKEPGPYRIFAALVQPGWE